MQSNSIFFDDLRKRGHTLTYAQAQSPELLLKKFGEFLFDNIVYFAPHTTEFNSITFKDFQEFIENGGNILFGVDEGMSDTVRGFAESCGVDFHAKVINIILSYCFFIIHVL